MPVKLNSAGGGSVTLTTPSTASDFTQTLPAGNGTILTTAGVTTPVEFAAGTAGLPSITTTGDTNTGAFFPAADTVAIGTGGSERLRIASAGQIGIGGANYGTSGQVLTSNGSGAAPSWQAAGGGTGALKNVQVFTSSGTYTRTSGVTTAVVIAVGGGGAAGGGANGGTGGTTSFGSHVNAVGGSGGGSGINGGLPGAGGTGGTGATIAIKGAPGNPGTDGDGSANSMPGNGGGQGGGTGKRASFGSGNPGVRGGGGGGMQDGNLNPSGGGGQGETCIKYTTTVGATETVTIGAGGAGAGNPLGGAGGAGYIIVYEYS